MPQFQVVCCKPKTSADSPRVPTVRHRGHVQPHEGGAELSARLDSRDSGTGAVAAGPAGVPLSHQLAAGAGGGRQLGRSRDAPARAAAAAGRRYQNGVLVNGDSAEWGDAGTGGSVHYFVRDLWIWKSKCRGVVKI